MDVFAQAVKVTKYYDPLQKKHLKEEYFALKKDTSTIKQGDYKRYNLAGKVVEVAYFEQGKMMRKHILRNEQGNLKEIAYYEPNGNFWKYNFQTDSLQKLVTLDFESQKNGKLKNQLDIPDQKWVVDSLMKTINDRGMRHDSRINSILLANDFNIESVYMNANLKYKNKKDWQKQHDSNDKVLFLLMTTIENYVPLRGRKIDSKKLSSLSKGK